MAENFDDFDPEPTSDERADMIEDMANDLILEVYGQFARGLKSMGESEEGLKRFDEDFQEYIKLSKTMKGPEIRANYPNNRFAKMLGDMFAHDDARLPEYSEADEKKAAQDLKQDVDERVGRKRKGLNRKN